MKYECVSVTEQMKCKFWFNENKFIHEIWISESINNSFEKCESVNQKEIINSWNVN